MYETQHKKLKLENERVDVAKLEAQATMIKEMNESTNVALSNRKEEAKILQADMSIMDPLARAWYMMYRERIGKEVLTAQEAAAPVHEVSPVMDEADVTGKPPITQPTQQSPVVEEPAAMEEPEVMEVLSTLYILSGAAGMACTPVGCSSDLNLRCLSELWSAGNGWQSLCSAFRLRDYHGFFFSS
jgi:hypothetical protein